MRKRIRKKRPKRTSRGRHDGTLLRQARGPYETDKTDSEDAWDDELAATAEPRPKRLPAERSAAPRPGGELTADRADRRHGVVVTLFSGSCQVESGRELFDCALPSRLARDQRALLAAGDEVTFSSSENGQVVEEILPRRSVLSRPDPHNPRLERLIAANIDLVVQVSSVGRPPLRPALIDRYLIAIERGGAEPLLCVNKIDLLAPEKLAAELHKLDVYRHMGLEILPCSTKSGEGIAELRAALAGRTAVFAGHSGVGKSSLLQAIDPEIEVATGALSRRFARGRHTTTRSRLYRLAGNFSLIDTPGIRELGLFKLEPRELRLYFPEFEEVAAGCRFNDCSHTHEPDCAVRAAVTEERIPSRRFATYLRILESLDEDDG